MKRSTENQKERFFAKRLAALTLPTFMLSSRKQKKRLLRDEYNNGDIVVPRKGKKAALRFKFDGFKLIFYIIYAGGTTASSSTS